MNIYIIKHENVCYVGISNDPKNRLSRHFTDAIKKPYHNEKTKWFFMLYENNIKPILEILEVVNGLQGDIENYWIEYYKKLNYKVLNIRKGGGGCESLTDEQKLKAKSNKKNPKEISERFRKAQSERRKGCKHSEESIDKIKISLTGHIHSDETKLKMSNSKIGKSTITEEGREKISLIHKDKPKSEDVKQKMSDSAKLYWENERLEKIELLKDTITNLKKDDVLITNKILTEITGIPKSTLSRYLKLI